MKVFIRHIGKGTFRRVEGTFLIFFRVNFKYVMCTKNSGVYNADKTKKMSFFFFRKTMFLKYVQFLHSRKMYQLYDMKSSNYIGLYWESEEI
jgi:hypothetical protein